MIGRETKMTVGLFRNDPLAILAMLAVNCVAPYSSS